MKKIMINIILTSIILFIMSSCSQYDKNSLIVKPNLIAGKVEGSVLISPNALNDSNMFVWGATVIKGDDNKYHMLYSAWESGEGYPKFSDAWILHSKIAYAISDEPDRNFKFQKIVLKGSIFDDDSTAWDAVSVHNPHIKRFNSKYYLYYTGSKDPGVQPSGSSGEKVNKRNRVQQSQQIGVIEFESFEDLLSGNFERPSSPLLSPRTRVKPDDIVNPSAEGMEAKPDNIIVVNPSVVKRESDNKFLLYFKGNLYDPYWRGVHGVAISDKPNGPFKALDDFVFDIKLKDGRIASAEDPYVWYHKRFQKFYAVFKDFSGNITEGKPGLAILESTDGLTWNKPPNPFFMKKEIGLESGATLQVSNLERPQFLIDEEGNPQVLYAACSIGSVGNKKDGSTFNVHIKLSMVGK